MIASLSGKVGSYGLSNWSPEDSAERQLAAFLGANGWSLVGSQQLISDRQLLSFSTPDCTRAIGVALVPWNGDLVTVLDAERGADYRLLFIEQGVVKKTPSRLGYLRSRLRTAASQLGIQGGEDPMLTAVLEPTECNATSHVPWAEFRIS